MWMGIISIHPALQPASPMEPGIILSRAVCKVHYTNLNTVLTRLQHFADSLQCEKKNDLRMHKSLNLSQVKIACMCGWFWFFTLQRLCKML